MFFRFFLVSVALISCLWASSSLDDTEIIDSGKESLSVAQNIKWHSYQQMIRDLELKKIEKPIMLFVGQSSCSYCAQELQAMHSDSGFMEFLNNSYYSVHVNQDTEHIDERFSVSLTPSFFVVDPATGAAMTPEPVKGAVAVRDLHVYLKKVKEAYDYYINSQRLK